MISEFNIYGVFFSGGLATAFAASIFLLILRRALTTIGFYRIVWHRNVVDLALFVILWCLVTALLSAMGGGLA